jgi:hypothetical protein
MWTLVLLLASFSAQATPVNGEQCLELRQFRGGGRGGCRVAIDKALQWMCIEERSQDKSYVVRFKDADQKLIRQFTYDQRRSESWGAHGEVFFTAADSKSNPDLKIGLTPDGDATVVVAKSRHCMPADSAKKMKR